MQMVKQMYILGTNTAVGGLNVERLTAVRNVAGGVEWRKNYVLKMKLHFEKTLLSLLSLQQYSHVKGAQWNNLSHFILLITLLLSCSTNGA